MCGFIGTLTKSIIDIENLNKCNELIECRGPDEKKSFVGKLDSNQSININLIFNRLSIIDLAENAGQPMFSKTFQTGIVFNGEIFNHRNLRRELENQGIVFSTSHSDSEVVLLGLSYYGLDYVKKFIGQFSIVFIDFKTQQVTLIRDRLGQKPLFYYSDDDDLFFSSNLKSLLKLKGEFQVDENNLYEYLNFGVIPAPNTLFKRFKKIEPGTYLTFDFNVSRLSSKKTEYWNPEKLINNNKFEKEDFMELFNDSVLLRLDSDVPYANFLSGGLDSTAIVKSTVSLAEKQLNTFSVITDNTIYDESKWINQVVETYNTNHINKVINSNVETEDINASIDAYDELICDPSTLPSYLLCNEMSKNFKVAISGDGGDELFGGYKRYFQTMNKKNNIQNIISKINAIYPGFFGSGNEFHLYSNDWKVRYASFLEDQNFIKTLGIKSSSSFIEKYLNYSNLDLKTLQLIDYNFYLKEIQMLKIDRASMANSLEVRSPMLDHRLIEYILGHENYNTDMDNPKKLLTEHLNQDFNKDFTNRPKQGFVVSNEDWIFSNLNHIHNVFKNGKIVYNLDRNILKKLNIRKSRMNGIRIWKLYFLERYINSI